MFGSLLYLITSRPDIMFSFYLCTRFQANRKDSHLMAIKRIFHYLNRIKDLRLWYPRGNGFTLVGYSDSDFVGFKIYRKSILGHCLFLVRL